MPAAKYKLTYFDAKGRAEMTRLMFVAADVKYEDERIKREDWPALKPKTPQSVLPILLVDGKTTIIQSCSIARYVARKLGMYGKNDTDATNIDQIMDTIDDFMKAAFPALGEKDETKKAELMKKFMSEDVPKYLGFLENLIKSFGKDGYAVSNSLSLADTAIVSHLDMLGLKDNLEKFPHLSAHVKKLEANKNIAKYLKDRPVTQF